MPNYELCHYGVKGMRWGVRRYQKKDGSLTPAGKKRYYDTPELNRQKAEMKSAKRARDISYNKWNNAHGRKEYEAARNRYMADSAAYNHAKLKYETNKEVARIQDKGIEFKNKSKHRLRLEEQYKKLGMSDEQAQAAANNRIKFEKTLATVAGLTVAAAAAYTANKVLKDRMDGIIKSGDILQRIEMQDTGGKLHDTFYVARGKHDTKRYYNLLGATRQKQTGEAYVMKLMAQKDVKIASKSKCRQAFKDLWDNDESFREACKRRGIGWEVGKFSYDKYYDSFNRELVGMRNEGPAKQFYDRLKEAGYGAIQDVNDMKYSGYAARNPLIVFDNKGGNIAVKSVKQITEDLSKKGNSELLKATGETLIGECLETYGPMSAAVLTGAAATAYYVDPTKSYRNQGGTSKWR